ncbi:MAG: type IV pilus modification protein PilV [Rhodoferax sp.]|nr:type IV pilus modification protein PilV [Rhodoferax sp.]
MGSKHTVTSSTTNATHAFRAGRPSRSESGFSLIEVLISIVVLSFGLLGMVGMQAASLQSNREARLQSSAVVLARELAELMRGNKAIGILTTGNPYLGDFVTPLAAATPSYCLNVAPLTTPCTDATDVGNAQMTEWLARVDAELPGAHVKTCFDSAPFDSDGLPRWACNNTGGVIVVKIGWTRGSTDRSKSGAAALEKATVPSVVFSVTAGIS